MTSGPSPSSAVVQTATAGDPMAPKPMERTVSATRSGSGNVRSTRLGDDCMRRHSTSASRWSLPEKYVYAVAGANPARLAIVRTEMSAYGRSSASSAAAATSRSITSAWRSERWRRPGCSAGASP